MKYWLFVFALAATCTIGSCCKQVETVAEPQKSDESGAQLATQEKEETPLLLDDEPLLLLDEESGGDEAAGPQADNSRCFVCHINYMEEDIAVTHAKVNMGCNYCHGESDEHIADESWASGGNGTAPDTMFPKPKINPFCMGCHTKDKIETVQHQPLFANMDKMVCTDCHGKHRITTPRKCKWK